MSKYPFTKKTYRERPQLKARRKLGRLEKHKDYVLRAKDYREKRKKLLRLKRLATERNPDEFNFGMEKTRVDAKTGKNTSAVPSGRQYTADEMRLMQQEDVAYLNMRRTVDLRRVEKLRSVLHALDATPRAVHTLFVDEGEDGEPQNQLQQPPTREELAKRLGTVPEVVFAKVRPRLEQLRDEKLVVGGDAEAAVQQKPLREKKYAELLARKKRAARIAAVARELEIKKQLAGPGRKYKIVDQATGRAHFVWRQERKK
jgi:U3 small nucleolar RNA-associated protein 11